MRKFAYIFGIDITYRIRPYIKETRIKDYEQMESSEIFKIKVN